MGKKYIWNGWNLHSEKVMVSKSNVYEMSAGHMYTWIGLKQDFFSKVIAVKIPRGQKPPKY